MSKFSINDFVLYKQKSQKITMITAYDFSHAQLIEQSAMDIILVGDSLGMVFQGKDNTLGVTIDDMIYHAKAVKKGAPNKFIIGDMPFLSYHTDINTTIKNAGRLICESGVDAVKVEINHHSSLEHILALQSAQIPVIAHIGMTPQSVNAFGGFRVQGRNKHQAEHIIHLAHECSKYGAVAVVIECVPADLAEQITNSLQIPTIGIGAGIGCDGQVLVFNDLVGLTKSPPKFAKCYLNSGELIINALNQYHEDVVALNYPDQNFSFK